MKFVEPIRKLEDLEELKSYLRKSNERDYMLFICGIYSTLRISDLLPLKKKDFAGERLLLVEKKTNNTKEIYIGPKLKRELKPYLLKLKDDDHLFKSQKGHNKPITRTHAYRILNAAAEECGIKRIGTHSMRKTFGYHYYKKTKNIALLQQLYSHSSEAITLRYIGVNQDMLDKAFKDFDY